MHFNFTTIILAHQDYGEKDRLYTLLTQKMGKMTVRGSSARKSGAKLAPHLEPMTLSHVAIAKNRGRGVITFALVEESFRNTRKNITAIKQSLRVLSITEKLLQDGDIHKDVYELLRLYLYTIDTALRHNTSDVVVQTVAEGYIFHLLACLGWQVSPTKCVQCKKQLSLKKQESNQYYKYSLIEGGFICVHCFQKKTYNQNRIIELSRNTMATLHIFSTNNIASLVKLKTSKKVCEELYNFSTRRIAWIR